MGGGAFKNAEGGSKNYECRRIQHPTLFELKIIDWKSVEMLKQKQFIYFQLDISFHLQTF